MIDADLGDHTLRSDVDVLVTVTAQLYLKANPGVKVTLRVLDSANLTRDLL